MDNIHSLQQNPTIELGPARFDYEHSHGAHRLFVDLAEGGTPCGSVRQGPLTDEMLEARDVLYLGLTDESLPAFSEREIATVERWVRRGGGLLVLSEHTNAYGSLEHTNPLLARFGIEATNCTSAETDPASQLAGRGWLRVTRFADHPVTRGLRAVAMTAAGSLRITDGSVVPLMTTSPEAFADTGDPATDPDGRYGDLAWQEGEAKGAQVLAAAREYGKGRVVVLADMNVIGDTWLHYGDNLAFARQTLAWLSDERIDLRMDGRYRMYINEWRTGGKMANCVDPSSFRVFYVNMNRDARVVAVAGLAAEGQWDALWLVAPSEPMDEGDLAWMEAHLQAGRPIVVVLDERELASAASRQLIERLAEGATIEGDPGSYPDGEGPLGGPGVLGEQLALSRWARIRVNAGEPWVWAETDGERWDIARRFPARAGRGEVIAFFQSRFWRTEFLGGAYGPPDDRQRAAWHLQWLVADHLLPPTPTP